MIYGTGLRVTELNKMCKIGDYYVQDKSNRRCMITSITSTKIQYIYNDCEKRGCQRVPCHSSQRRNFINNFRPAII